MSNTDKRFLFAYEWDNAFDNCTQDEKYYSFGTYIDLCGMSPEDALKAMNTCPCNGGGNSGGGSSSSGDTSGSTETITNTLYISFEEVTA